MEGPERIVCCGLCLCMAVAVFSSVSLVYLTALGKYYKNKCLTSFCLPLPAFRQLICTLLSLIQVRLGDQQGRLLQALRTLSVVAQGHSQVLDALVKQRLLLQSKYGRKYPPLWQYLFCMLTVGRMIVNNISSLNILSDKIPVQYRVRCWSWW